MKTKLLLILIVLLAGGSYAQTTDGRRPQIAFDKFVAILDQAGNKAQILDARTNEEFKQNHVKGAINVDTEERLAEVVAGLKKEGPVFVYSIGNGRSGRIARQLDENGFKEVYEFPGGLSKWIGEGKPVVSTVGEGLSGADYNELVAKDQWVLVDITSRYCGGCKKLDPILDNFEKEVQGKVKIVKIEAYENKKLVNELEITGLPTLLLYKDGKVIWTKKGLTSEDELIAKVAE